MRKYEAVFVLDVRGVNDDGAAFSEELRGNFEAMGGKVVESVAMGRKQFAREIKKRKTGIYWNYVFELSPEKLEAVRGKYRLDERVLRMMVVNYERSEDVSGGIDKDTVIGGDEE